ncbi:MAG: PilZ domain-containing protein [Nitrospiraceae bacterium]|nr:MAG: PilZ domain-containing protein [Nitrospiraceae bacterium]
MGDRQNCWEFNKCGREPGGSRAGETGVCPATTAISCSGLYNGINGGRICWAIAGTFAAGRISGAYAREFSCLNCDFLRKVCKDENICKFDQLTPYRIYNNSSRMFGRREFMRIDVHLDLKFSIAGDARHNHIYGVTIDFGCGGFSFISEHFMPSSKGPVKYRIKLPGNNTCTHVSGEIVWKTEVRDRCLAGVKIMGLNDDAKRDILDYAYSRWLKGVRLQ